MTQPASRVLLPSSNSSGNIAAASIHDMPVKDNAPKSPTKVATTKAAVKAAITPAATGSGRSSPRSASPTKSIKKQASTTAVGGHHSHNQSVITAHEPVGARTRARQQQQQQQPQQTKVAAPTDVGEESKGSWRSWTRGQGLAPTEMEIINLPEVRRKANVCQLYFLSHYFDNLRYLSDRKARVTNFHATADPNDRYYQQDMTSYFGRERALLRKRRTKLQLAQFHIITQVGQGGYGEVFLARKRETGEICALKKLKKRVLVKMNEVKHVLVERDILTATRTPWLVKLLYAFQDSEHVYLAMEYVPGGDFRTMLNNSGVLREEYARFYMAEMFVAVNEVHKLGYIHRDLKPENFLIDIEGHIKLTDFGLAAGALNPGRIDSLRHRLDQVKDTDFVYRTPAERGSMYKAMRAANANYADSVVGSPDYMAPEVLRGKTYGYSVDYWSLGCMLFEFLCGFPPFSGGSADETWANLKNWHRVLQRPVYTKPEDLAFNLTDVAWDSVLCLIDTPERRCASLETISKHPFFKSLDFRTLRTLTPPLVPKLQSEIDTYYFDNFDDPEDMAKYKEVQEKQRNVEGVQERAGVKACGGRGLWAGFTFGKNGVGVNGRSVPASPTDDLADAFQTMF